MKGKIDLSPDKEDLEYYNSIDSVDVYIEQFCDIASSGMGGGIWDNTFNETHCTALLDIIKEKGLGEEFWDKFSEEVYDGWEVDELRFICDKLGIKDRTLSL